MQPSPRYGAEVARLLPPYLLWILLLVTAGICAGAATVALLVTINHALQSTGDAIRDVNGRAVNTFVLARAFGSALFFLLIGLMLDWAGLRAVEPAATGGSREDARAQLANGILV
jgi:hypothetical protein